MQINKTTVCIIFLMVLLAVNNSSAQKGQIWIGPSDTNNPRWAKKEDFDGSSYVFCRGYFRQDYYSENVWGWYVDYPGVDFNFMVRLSEITKTKVRTDQDGKPIHVVVELDNPIIFNCPMIFLSDVGTIAFSEKEIENLKQYFNKGGFIWADDFWGTSEWSHWEKQLRRILPSLDFPIIDIPADHPIMNQLYKVEKIPQIPNIGFWYQNNKATSERGQDSIEVHFRGVKDKKGRLIAVMTHNTDIGDSLEREATDNYGEYYMNFSPTGYVIAINILLYALTH